jgi:hypothetical protein
MMMPSGSQETKRASFSFQVLLKPTLINGKGITWQFPNAEGHGWSLGQDANNLHTFTTEKAEKKRRMFNLEYNIKSKMF